LQKLRTSFADKKLYYCSPSGFIFTSPFFYKKSKPIAGDNYNSKAPKGILFCERFYQNGEAVVYPERLRQNGFARRASPEWRSCRLSGTASPEWLRQKDFARMASPEWLRQNGFARMASPEWLRHNGFARMASPEWLRHNGFAPSGIDHGSPLRGRNVRSVAS